MSGKQILIAFSSSGDLLNSWIRRSYLWIFLSERWRFYPGGKSNNSDICNIVDEGIGPISSTCDLFHDFSLETLRFMKITSPSTLQVPASACVCVCQCIRVGMCVTKCFSTCETQTQLTPYFVSNFTLLESITLVVEISWLEQLLSFEKPNAIQLN